MFMFNDRWFYYLENQFTHKQHLSQQAEAVRKLLIFNTIMIQNLYESQNKCMIHVISIRKCTVIFGTRHQIQDQPISSVTLNKYWRLTVGDDLYKSNKTQSSRCSFAIFVTFEFEIVKCNAPKVREVMKT